MYQTIPRHFPQYLHYLRNLVNMPSVFTNPSDIKKVLNYCRDVFKHNLPHFHTFYDRAGNLISLPQKIDPTSDLVYLNAHADTVDANPDEWDAPYSPFAIYENHREIVARGVSDCKAGVAFQLFLSFLANLGCIDLTNLIFTISSREEGAGKKSARAIGKAIGSNLPVSHKTTYLLVLENTAIPGHPPTLYVYHKERTGYVIKISGFIKNLQDNLDKLNHWNPVCIYPDNREIPQKAKTFTQKGGHICSVPREQNLLTALLHGAKENALLKAGDEKALGVAPAKIQVSSSPMPIRHSLVLCNRSFDSLQEVKSQLQGLRYKKLKDFSLSQDLNARPKLSRTRIAPFLKGSPQLKIKRTFNIGCSDATIIYHSLRQSLQKKIIPVVIGPGTRSQRTKRPPRLTHGRNETFDKKSGKAAVCYISQLLGKLGCI